MPQPFVELQEYQANLFAFMLLRLQIPMNTKQAIYCIVNTFYVTLAFSEHRILEPHLQFLLWSRNSQGRFNASFRKRGNSWHYRIHNVDRRTRVKKEAIASGFNTKTEAKHAGASMKRKSKRGFDLGCANQLVV